MADNREKQATCPICGYTDTALDAEALEEAMAQHMQQAHNMSAPVNPGNTDLKQTGNNAGVLSSVLGDTNNTPPTVPPGTIVAPGNNVGPNEIP
jgi:hypothetical protein